MLPEEIEREYIQWLKDNGKAEYKLDNVYYKDNKTIKCKKEMIWKFNSTPEDFEEFCKIKNISYDDLKYAVTVKLNMELNKPLKQNIPKNKKTTTVTYIGMKTDTFTFYQCDDCGCAEVLSNSYYCPNCGKKII